MQLSESNKKTILDLIDNLDFDEYIKSSILKYCNDDFFNREFKNNSSINKNRAFIQRVLKLIPKNYTDVTWHLYCKSMKKIDNDKAIDRKLIARTILSQIYKIIIINLDVECKDLHNLKPYIDFFMEQERSIDYESNTKFLRDNIATNFSLNSTLDRLAYFEFDSRGNKKETLKTIINLNTNNEYLKEILIKYLSQVRDKRELSYIRIRRFIYYFSAITDNFKEVKNINDFDFDLFKYQVRIFSRLKQNEQTDSKILGLLKSIYIFLMDTYNKDLFINENITKEILGSTTFYETYSLGYRFIKKSSLLDVPTADRWAIYDGKSKAHMNLEGINNIDFTVIKDEDFKNDLKKYYWYYNQANIRTLSARFNVLSEFLNMKSEYDNEMANVISLEIENYNKYTFDSDFIYEYIDYMTMKIPTTTTRGKAYDAIKSFLRHYKHYSIDDLLFEEFIIKNRDCYDGGTPLTKEDFILFKNKFLEYRNKSVEDELNYIIFNLAVTTKLRPGEIINLQTDYKESEINGGVIIKYYSKISNGELVNTEISIEKSKLLDKAIELTNPIRKHVSNELKKFIFIKEDKGYKNRYIKFGRSFSKKFYDIQKEISTQLTQKYKPYNLRATYIDTMYTEGIKENMSPIKIANMAGNSLRVAIKNYRRKTTELEYAELFTGVIIADVNTEGTILKSDNDIDSSLPIVEDHLGNCNSKSCSKDFGNYFGDYKCLICKSFVTSLSRLKLFEDRIIKIRFRKEHSTNDIEKKYLDEELKLLGIYLNNMVKLLNDK